MVTSLRSTLSIPGERNALSLVDGTTRWVLTTRFASSKGLPNVGQQAERCLLHRAIRHPNKLVFFTGSFHIEKGPLCQDNTRPLFRLSVPLLLGLAWESQVRLWKILEDSHLVFRPVGGGSIDCVRCAEYAPLIPACG